MKKGIPTCHTEAGGLLSSSERMTYSRRNLERGNSSRAAGGTSYAQRKVPRTDVDRQERTDVNGQELLPGIPNHVKVENIASKLDWKTCNMLQLVSRAWRQAIYNRNVYDARVFSKSTKAFLVVLTYDNQAPVQELVLTLYCCRDDYSLRLPPIPSSPQVRARPHCIDCVCLEGRVYLWIRQRREASRVQLYVLDLAGHRKWAKRNPVNYPVCCHGFGVLDGKIYRFQSKQNSVLTLEDPFQGRALSIEEKVQQLPHTEIYDPVHDAWSLITPTPPVSAVVSDVDLERHLALFSDWAEEKLAADPSKTFLTSGRYESYFSEWKQKLSRECSTTSTVGNDSSTQVYYLNSRSAKNGLRCQEMLFFGGKLVRYEKLRWYTADIDIQEYNTRTNIWEHWKSISLKLQPRKKDYTFSIEELDGFAAANNSIWAMAGVYNSGGQIIRYFLVRSRELLDDSDVKSVTWIDTGFQVSNKTDFRFSDPSRWHDVKPILRPIYL